MAQTLLAALRPGRLLEGLAALGLLAAWAAVVVTVDTELAARTPPPAPAPQVATAGSG